MNWPHCNFQDKWNEYGQREYVGHLLDKRHFDALCPWDASMCWIEPLGAGCLDAPREVPFGSSQLVMTVGGYVREHYNRCNRDELHMTTKQKVQRDHEVAEMIRQVLKETE